MLFPFINCRESISNYHQTIKISSTHPTSFPYSSKAIIIIIIIIIIIMKSSSSSSAVIASILAAVTTTTLLSCHAAAFLNLPFINQANPALAKYAEAQVGDQALLKIHLDIGQVVDVRKSGGGSGGKGGPVMTGNRLGIDGLVLELHGDKIADYQQLSFIIIVVAWPGLVICVH